MNIHKDFEEFLRLLNEEQVEYVVVGGYAVAYHGYVRATRDIDLLFAASEKNIRGIRKALNRFGLAANEIDGQTFTDPGTIIRIGIPPVMIELINTISGLTFEQVWSNRIRDKYGDVDVDYISLSHLLINKKMSGRPKDMADFDELGGNRMPIDFCNF